MSIPPRFQGIDEHDVQIASQTAVLEAVIQNHKLSLEFFNGDLCPLDPIGMLQVRYVWAQPIQYERFIILPTRLGAVSATQEADSRLPFAKPTGKEGHHRRLASSASRDVADADDWDRCATNLPPAGIEGTISDTNGRVVKPGCDPEPTSQTGRTETAMLPRDQRVKISPGSHRIATHVQAQISLPSL